MCQLATRILPIVFLLSFLHGYAQKRTITGYVTDDQSIPLIQANVVVQNTDRGTITDENGFYQIEADSSDVLEFSYVGFIKTLVQVGAQSQIDVQMVIANELEEVIVIGYGTTTRKQLTDNISKVDEAQIREIPTPAVQGTLVGKMAGVQVSQTGGRVDSGFKIRVRGVSSVTGDQEPLYVIDGVPIIKIDQSANGSPINALAGLNPDDIASVEVLKDASSAAIYGARGTNGVVLITTKTGSKGDTKVSFRSSFGISEATNRVRFLNTEEYVELFTEAALNSGFTEDDAAVYFNLFAEAENDWKNAEVDTDWQDLALVTGSVTDVGLSVSGGNEKTNFFISTGYNRTEGIIRGNDLDRYSIRVNSDHLAKDWLRIGTNTSLSKTLITRLAGDNDFANPMGVIAQIPFTRPYAEDGITPNANTLYYNFLFQETNAEHRANIWRGLMKVYAELIFNDRLRFRSELGYDFNSQIEEQFFGSQTLDGAGTDGYGISYSIQNDKYVLSNYFTYEVSKENWDLNAVLGMSYEEDVRRFQRIEGINFPSDDLRTLTSAGEISGGFTDRTAFSFVSYFARASANFKNKYLVKASVRVDGSSRFGENNRYGTFPAFSAGWVLSEEPFLKGKTSISNLKLRASWGITGNANIGDFVSRTNFVTNQYNRQPGFWMGSLGDPNLSWEETKQFDGGLDIGFFRNRLLASVDYYNKKTEGILLVDIIPSTNGIRFVRRNAADIMNEGIEFTLDTKNFANEKFQWNTSFNIAYNRNEVLTLADGADFIRDFNIFREGEAAASFYLVEYAGVDPENGDALFYRNSIDEDGVIDRTTTNNYGEASRTIVGNPFPDFIAGLTNTIYWKGFDLNFVFQGEWGAERYNMGGIDFSSNASFFDNQTNDQLQRWQQPGDQTLVPQARLFGGNGTQDSSRYLESADFIRLRDLSLGFTFPKELNAKMKISRLRIYFSALNLWTYTNYKGWDPESTADFFSGLTQFSGIDFYSPPPAKTFSLGFNIDF